MNTVPTRVQIVCAFAAVYLVLDEPFTVRTGLAALAIFGAVACVQAAPKAA